MSGNYNGQAMTYCAVGIVSNTNMSGDYNDDQMPFDEHLLLVILI